MGFREDILKQFNKIPYDPGIDTKDLNLELADILCQKYLLREILQSDSETWGIQDFKEIIEILSRYGFAYWEVTRVFEAYGLNAWTILNENQKKELTDKYDSIQDQIKKDNFIIEFDIFPFRVSTEGIEKHFQDDRTRSEELDGYEFITKTPVIIHSIGSCLDDETYMYQIKYKTITGQIYNKWMTPDLLLTSNMKELVNIGLQLIDADQKNLKLYFKKLLGNAYKIPSEFTARTNGWKRENTIFITGSTAHMADGKKPILALTEEIAAAYEIKGNKKIWIENLTPLLDFDLIRLKCYATVTAMLLRFIGVKSFIVHNYYESSGLKSVSMQLAASLIGNPLEMVKDADSTKVGIEKTLQYNTDTPIYFDETSNNPEFQNSIYMIGNEQGKNRGTKDGGIDKAGKWKTVVQTTGEIPLSKGNNVKTGQQIRVLEIYEGIPRLEADYIEKVKETLDNNYGLFQDEIIQEIFIWKDKLKKLYKQLNMFFEKSKTVFADRSKTYFVALAVGGFLVEEVFKNNKIPTKDPIDICKKYYQRIVIEDPTIPYYLRALDTTYSWHQRNKKSFEYAKELDQEYSAKGPLELYGWITKEAIYYDPDKLQEYLELKGFNFERVIDDWRNNKILEPQLYKDSDGSMKYRSWKNNSNINGQRIKGVKIPFSSLKQVLEIREDDIQDMKNSIDKNDSEEIQFNLIESCSRYLNENPKLKNVSYTAEEVTNFFIKSKDREELLLYGRDNIIKAFEICKRGGLDVK